MSDTKYYLYDDSISWKAKGIMAYLINVSPESTAEILIKISSNGRDSTRSGIRELKKAGYITSLMNVNSGHINKGSRSKYGKYLASQKWKDLRKKVFDRDNHECRKCKKTLHLQVHHIDYDNLYDENLEDLITLCARCHKIEHNKWIFPTQEKIACPE